MTLREKINDYAGRIPYLGDILTAEVDDRILARVALGLALTFSPIGAKAEEPAKAEPKAKGSIEMMVEPESVTLDVIVRVPLASRTHFLSRTLMTINYGDKGKANTFHMLKADHELVYGFGLVVAAAGNPQEIKPRLGAQGFWKVGDIGFYTHFLVSPEEKPEMLSDTIISYSRELREGTYLVGTFENATFFNEKGNKLSVQKARFGFGDGFLQGGIAVNMLELGPEGKFSCVVGFYGKVTH